MKFSKLSQLFLVSSIGLLVASFLTACEITTIDYVFVASSSSAVSGSSNDGQIATYAVDSESGALRPGGATVSSGGLNPVAVAVTSDYANLYVANEGTSSTGGSVVHFTIATNGALTAKDTLTLSSAPVALAVNTAGTYLYVASCTNSAISPAVTCTNTGTLTEYALTSGTIGAAAAQETLKLYGSFASFSGDILVPTGITVLANNGSNILGNAVYVTAYDQFAYNPGGSVSSNANPGWIFGYTIGTGGALTAATNPYEAGIKPTAIISDPTDRFVYVTDYASNGLIGYTILDGSRLGFLTSGPFRTGNEPSAIAIDPRGIFIYVSNALDSTVSAYEITLATGIPTTSTNPTGSNLNSTDTQPVAVAVDPALGRFVYTANYLGNSVSGFRLNPTSGALSTTQATPYPTDDKPTALVVIPHGNHATEAVAP
ncbi:MAG: beta-propeller fold lactonase family protein [Terracidiphilus sp.]|jgi:6-phosphogluconolactonase (cycloisomerase 2 family)